MSVGPESTVALMAGMAVAPLAAGNPDRALALSAALSLIIAAWCFIARMARLGVIADLLSQPLLVGYLAGGAVLMVVGQLGKMTGTQVAGESILAQLQSFAGVVARTQLPTLLVGAGTLALLIAIDVLMPRRPAPLIAVAERPRSARSWAWPPTASRSSVRSRLGCRDRICPTCPHRTSSPCCWPGSAWLWWPTATTR
jgi:SulP family sulfate permease